MDFFNSVHSFPTSLPEDSSEELHGCGVRFMSGMCQVPLRMTGSAERIARCYE